MLKDIKLLDIKVKYGYEKDGVFLLNYWIIVGIGYIFNFLFYRLYLKDEKKSFL